MQLKDVVKAEALDPHTVRYTFTGTQTRDLPLVVAGLPVLSKAYYATREFDQTTLEPPLGSGPYKIGDFKHGTYVSYRRRDDYWAKDLPVNRGRFNFDELRYEYYPRPHGRAREPARPAPSICARSSPRAIGSPATTSPPVKEGRLVKLTLPDESPSGAQGFFLNTRRPKLADLRVRKALDYAFDFEWTNKNIFYGLYHAHRELLRELRHEGDGQAEPGRAGAARAVPRPAAAGGVRASPTSRRCRTARGKDRKLLREAGRLLDEAGWEVKDGKRVNAKGETLELEFLIVDPVSERILTPYVKNLQALGIAASIRRVDPAQYERRVKSFDFDMVTTRYSPAPDARAWS